LRKTQQEILSVKIEEANRKKDEELKNVTGTEKQIEERKYEITKTYNVEISRWKTDLEKQTQEKILELRNNTLKLIYDAELVGFEKEKVLHELRLKEIEQNEKKRLKETSDKREKSAISSEAAAAREKENADFKRIEEKRALEIRDLELETARLIFEIKTEGFERDKFLHEQKMQQIKDEAEAKREEAKGDKKKTERINENEQAKLDYEDFTFYDKLTQKYADYASKRRELAERFNAEICEMEANTTKFTQAQIEHAKEMRDRALAQLDDNAMKSSNILVRMFADTNKESSKELEKLKAEVKAFLDYLKNGKFEAVGVNEAGQAIDKFGNTYEQFQNLIKPDKLKELENGLENVTEASYKFNNGIDDIVVSYKKLLKAFKSGNLKDQQKAFLEFANTIKSVGDIAADVGKNIINSFKGISPELDKQISEVEKVFDTISTIWNRAMQGAQIVGPVGAAVGAAVGAVEAIIKLVTDKKKKDAEWEKEKAQIILDHEREMYELTKKRLKVIREIRETELGFLNRSEESLNKQLAENEKRRTNAYNNLMGKGFDIPITYKADGKTYETTKRGNFWDVFYKGGKGHYPSEDEMRDYINKLEEKFGKNNPDVIALKELLAELDSANEEREEQKRQIAEILERQKENYAGITYQGLLDSIVNAFRDGTFAAEDFANNFKDFMKQALLNALSNQMALAASGFLDKISLVSEKLLKREELPEEYRGKTEAEIWEMIQAEYEAMGELANEKFEALKKIFGGDNLFKDKRGDNKAQGFAQATSQDSINELNGRFASIKIDTSQISENMKIMLENMQNQLAYLKRIAENTDKLNDMAREILEINSWCSRIENTGIKLAS